MYVSTKKIQFIIINIEDNIVLNQLLFSASGNTVDQFGNTHCIVSENGSVIWVPPAKLTTFCTMDLRHWPQDEQICIFTFGSWTYDGIQINIETSDLYDLESNVKTPVTLYIFNIENIHIHHIWHVVKVYFIVFRMIT